MKQDKKQKRVKTARIEESLSYSVVVRDKKGRVIQRIAAPSRSFVEQWNQLINIMAKATGATVKDVDGADLPVTVHKNTLMSIAAIGSTLQGLRVGKGFTAVAIDDFNLETPCEEGVGVDEFNHQAMTWTAPAVVASTCSFTAKRIFVNNSGATISGIRELGCRCFGWSAGSEYFLGFRDVLPGGVTVPDGGSITVTYTIAVTV